MPRHTPPLIPVAMAPFIPWLIGGVLMYLYWDKILAGLGAGITGKSVEEYKKDVTTVKEALKTPVATTKEIVRYVTGTQTPKGPGEVLVKGQIVKLPYPSPKTMEEFRANQAAIDAILKAVA